MGEGEVELGGWVFGDVLGQGISGTVFKGRNAASGEMVCCFVVYCFSCSCVINYLFAFNFFLIFFYHESLFTHSKQNKTKSISPLLPRPPSKS